MGLPPVNSFEAVAREWVEPVQQAEVSAGLADRTLIRFEKEVFPWAGRVQIDGLTAPDPLTVLRRIEAGGTFETTHRVKHACGQVIR